MARGRHYPSAATPALSVDALEEELQRLKQQRSELRRLFRLLKNGRVKIGKLEEKLTRRFGSAKWTASQIKELQPDKDERSFHRSVAAHPPASRRRRQRAQAGEAADQS
jgi:hypothetical protein